MAFVRGVTSFLVICLGKALFVQRSAGPGGGDASALDSQVVALSDTLAAMRAQATAAVDKLKQECDANLTAQKEVSRGVGEQNSDMTTEIENLEKQTSDLRAEASALTASNERLRDEVQKGYNDLGTAREFAAVVLNRTETGVAATPELAVLDELSREDAEKEELDAHSRRISEVGGARASLLQVAAAQPKDQAEAAGAMLATLSESLDVLSEQRTATRDDLKTQCLQSYEEAAAQQKDLYEQQKVLDASRGAAQTTVDRLQTAVGALHSTNKALTASRVSLFGFLQKMGDRGGPEGAAAPKASKEEKTGLTALVAKLR